MKINSPVVVFTSKEYVEIIRNMREDRPIHIEMVNFEDLYMWKRYKEQWIVQHSIDPEKHIHSPELYSIWSQKSVFVKTAISINAFNTKCFFWCDIGAFRSEEKMDLYKNFPITNYFQTEKILFGSIFPLTDDDKTMRSDGIIGDFLDPNKWRMVDGLWGGDKNACLKWSAAYETMLNKYFISGRFSGKDQSVMMSALLADPSLGVLAKPTINEDIWFYFQSVLSGRSHLTYCN